MAFEVRVSKEFESELSKLVRSGQKDVVRRIVKCLEQLALDLYRPRPGVDILRLESVDPELYRLRVWKYRVMYSIDEKQKIVNVTKVIHRKKAYR